MKKYEKVVNDDGIKRNTVLPQIDFAESRCAILWQNVYNAVLSMDLSCDPKFERLDIPAMLIALYTHKHDTLWNGLIEKRKKDYAPTDADLAQGSGLGYLQRCLIMKPSENTIKTANRILIYNGVINMWGSKKTPTKNNPNSVVFNPDIVSALIDCFGKAPQKYEIWSKNYEYSDVLAGLNAAKQGIDINASKFLVKKVLANESLTNESLTNEGGTPLLMRDYSLTNEGGTPLLMRDYSLTNEDSISISKLSKNDNKNDLNSSVSGTPQKNQFLNNQKENQEPTPTQPKPQIEKKPIVNLVNYNSAKEFTDELANHLMDNRKSIKETVLEFDFAKIPNYSEKYAGIVYSGKYEGLKNLKSYDSHFEKLRGMGVVGEVNAPKIEKAQPQKSGIPKRNYTSDEYENMDKSLTW